MKLNRKQRKEWAFARMGPDYTKAGEMVAPSKARLIRAMRRDQKAAKVCRRKGHVLRDLDVGDPETGPCPEIVCDRCGVDS